MTHPVFDLHNDVSLGLAISGQNEILPMSNADIRRVEPEMKSTIVGFTPDGAPIWRRIPVTRVRKNNGWDEHGPEASNG